MANCRCTAAQRRRAKGHAAVLREAAEELRAETCSMEREDMPMNRYVSPNTIPGCPGCHGIEYCCGEDEVQAMVEQLVELTVCQNQLLTDLLGAVNALTAAMLSRQTRC